MSVDSRDAEFAELVRERNHYRERAASNAQQTKDERHLRAVAEAKLAKASEAWSALFANMSVRPGGLRSPGMRGVWFRGGDAVEQVEAVERAFADAPDAAEVTAKCKSCAGEGCRRCCPKRAPAQADEETREMMDLKEALTEQVKESNALIRALRARVAELEKLSDGASARLVRINQADALLWRVAEFGELIPGSLYRDIEKHLGGVAE